MKLVEKFTVPRSRHKLTRVGHALHRIESPKLRAVFMRDYVDGLNPLEKKFLRELMQGLNTGMPIAGAYEFALRG